MTDYSQEFTALVKAYEASGGDPIALLNRQAASLMVSHRKILGTNTVPGVQIEGEETPTGVRAQITVAPGTVVEFPVHLCFGVLPPEGLQEVRAAFDVGDGA